jgi:hypothetical protein
MDFVKSVLVIPLTEEGFLKGNETLYTYLTSINRASVGHFGGLKVSFFNVILTLDLQVSSIHKASFRPFGGLTMRFFKIHETLG